MATAESRIEGNQKNGMRSAPALWSKPLGEILIAMGKITRKELDEALKVQAEKGGRIGEILVNMKALSYEDVITALARQLDLEVVEGINAENIDLELISNLPISFAKQHSLIPLQKKEGVIVVATSEPLNVDALDELAIILDGSIKTLLAQPSTVLDAINRTYDRRERNAGAVMDSIGQEDDLNVLTQELEEPQDLIDVDDEAPIIRLVNSLLTQSVKERASDIHIEPAEKDISVRFRIDGVLYEIIRPPKRIQAAIISRIKIMGGLNIAEKRLPQDGRIRIKIAGKDIDIRLSTLPTSHGERVVMRLLERGSLLLDLTQLGFTEDKLAKIHSIIHKSHGIFLVTGPTGSGKTTTLYSALSAINSPDVNIITVEDPVEYQLPGISQIQVQPKIGLTFAHVLRSILRQDPDVILIGETRDLETAEIAIQASLTGHLVFSTLHTNDAASSITRLVDMGVEPFLVSSSLVAILAQRLIRRVCPTCREPYTPTKADLDKIGLDRSLLKDDIIYRSRGCPECLNTGYQGREGIYELMTVDDDIRQMILTKGSSTELKKAARARGMLTLREDGARKVAEGLTTIAEVMRVTQDDVI
ncbi:MAG: type II secretion system ATPase GspE [Myxococcota bacterium]